ncbi:NAD(P)H-dependent oxidoreductase [Tenacibaculum agarivorans]|uniref:NAD(P)H-dependent oxidoreductase n=1 Tax=Tenacibaculum agarivorans TaxID=1908389 RepID=UPI00094BABEC|nr:NAD(P)H-dependent oxidoreductase [Tenacibaculum agarivorans]
MSTTLESLQWRYAVKKFDENKQLSEEQIKVVTEAFNLTATSYGLQPVSLVVIKNKELQKKLVEHSWNQQQVAQASHVLVICVPKEHTVKDVENYFRLVKDIRNTPDEILEPFKNMLMGSFEQKTQEELFQWNKNQAYIALGNLLTVCAVEKIDACPMEGFIPEQYDELLDLHAKNLRSVLVMPIGFRAEDDFMKNLKKVRKQTNKTVLHID